VFCGVSLAILAFVELLDITSHYLANTFKSSLIQEEEEEFKLSNAYT